MKHNKLFESYSIEKRDFPENGYELYSRERLILIGLVGYEFLNNFEIRKEDNYYYTIYEDYYNRFDGFNKLKDYIVLTHLMTFNTNEYDFLKIIESATLDLSFDDNYLIRYSSIHGHLNIVKLLLKDPRVDPSVDDNFLIQWASTNGHTEIVKLLLKDPRVDPSDCDNVAIKMASRNGYTEIVKLLLKNPRVDPSDSIRIARNKGRIEVVRLLIKDERVRAN